jgi:hypothetical protein
VNQSSKIVSLGSIIFGVLIITFLNPVAHIILGILGAPLTWFYYIFQFIGDISLPSFTLFPLYFVQYQLIAFSLNKYQNKMKVDYWIRGVIILVINMAIVCFLYLIYAFR